MTDFARYAEVVARALLGEPNKRLSTRLELRFGRHGSVSVDLKRGVWFDHENGLGGGVLDMIHQHLSLDASEAAAWIEDLLGVEQLEGTERRASTATPPHRPEPTNTDELARKVWREAVPAAGSPVEAYLQHRGGLVLPSIPVLRHHPACPRGAERLPAMIALMTDAATAKPCGLHRTFLKPDGSGKVDDSTKMMLGSAGIIRLVADSEVGSGLGICEGIEKSLAVMQLAGWSPVWCATSAGGIGSFPVLPGIECLTIFADTDDAGQSAALKCAQRWVDAGVEARIETPPQGDWSDALGDGP
jgi:hypothetical protein